MNRIPEGTAACVPRGVRVRHESDTYQMILDEGAARARRESILIIGEELIGVPDDSVWLRPAEITDLERLTRMLRRSVKAADWKEILDTP